MEVSEVREGFVLRGPGIVTPFVLPDAFQGAPRPGAPPAVAPRPPCAAGQERRPEPRRRFPWSRRRPAPPPTCT